MLCASVSQPTSGIDHVFHEYVHVEVEHTLSGSLHHVPVQRDVLDRDHGLKKENPVVAPLVVLSAALMQEGAAEPVTVVASRSRLLSPLEHEPLNQADRLAVEQLDVELVLLQRACDLDARAHVGVKVKVGDAAETLAQSFERSTSNPALSNREALAQLSGGAV